MAISASHALRPLGQVIGGKSLPALFGHHLARSPAYSEALIILTEDPASSGPARMIGAEGLTRFLWARPGRRSKAYRQTYEIVRHDMAGQSELFARPTGVKLH